MAFYYNYTFGVVVATTKQEVCESIWYFTTTVLDCLLAGTRSAHGLYTLSRIEVGSF